MLGVYVETGILRGWRVCALLACLALALGACGPGGGNGGGASVSGVLDNGPNHASPFIYNFSASSGEKVSGLVRQAIDGLGFSDATGPSSDDKFFVSRRLMVWIDQTGFYGKVNGIWRLNEQAGDSLDFVLKEAGGRSVNMLIPGEDGDGRWPSSYAGGEHIEFGGANGGYDGDWDAMYSLNESLEITNPDIPWWAACNGVAPSWDTKFTPIVEEVTETGVKLIYEGSLVKRADKHNFTDAAGCGGDYLFADGIRRRVYVRVGLEFYADQKYFDRTVQVRNSDGNPPFDGPESFVGGFVLSRWPNPHSLKRFGNYLRPEQSQVQIWWGDNLLTMLSGEWNKLYDLPIVDRDVVLGWAGQPVTLGVNADYANGQALTVENVGPSDNRDSGICLCYAHGGIEMGGGLLHGSGHAESSLPINGGEMSVEARRRLTLH